MDKQQCRSLNYIFFQGEAATTDFKNLEKDQMSHAGPAGGAVSMSS